MNIHIRERATAKLLRGLNELAGSERGSGRRQPRRDRAFKDFSRSLCRAIHKSETPGLQGKIDLATKSADQDHHNHTHQLTDLDSGGYNFDQIAEEAEVLDLERINMPNTAPVDVLLLLPPAGREYYTNLQPIPLGDVKRKQCLFGVKPQDFPRLVETLYKRGMVRVWRAGEVRRFSRFGKNGIFAIRKGGKGESWKRIPWRKPAINHRRAAGKLQQATAAKPAASRPRRIGRANYRSHTTMDDENDGLKCLILYTPSAGSDRGFEGTSHCICVKRRCAGWEVG